MGAWFKCDIHGALPQHGVGVASVAGTQVGHGVDFGMSLATEPVIAFAGDSAPSGVAITAPTMGFGEAPKRPQPASCRARFMNFVSMFMLYRVNIWYVRGRH